MTSPIGFDPTGVLSVNVVDGGTEEFVEVTLYQRDDGTWRIVIEHADESIDEITVRSDFLVGLAARAANAA